MSDFHHDQATCEYGANLKPAVGEFVRLCTAMAVWRVRSVEPDGRLLLDPTPGPGWTWFRPATVTTDHVSDILPTASWEQ